MVPSIFAQVSGGEVGNVMFSEHAMHVSPSSSYFLYCLILGFIVILPLKLPEISTRNEEMAVGRWQESVKFFQPERVTLDTPHHGPTIVLTA